MRGSHHATIFGMGILEAVALGVLQGVTEFLPISSTGHLVLLRAMFGVAPEHALAYDAVLHLATAAAVVVYFRRDLVRLLHTFFRLVGRLPVEGRERTLLYALLGGTLPAVGAGLVLEPLIATEFRSTLLVALVLLVGSLLFGIAEWRYVTKPARTPLTVRKGVLIGCFQALALLPGMSRSGITITGGMLLGLAREEAARFAFLLAIPVIIGAGGVKLFELTLSPQAVAWGPLLCGTIAAFGTGMAAIHFMLGFLRRFSLWPFIWYRVALATAVLLFLVLG